MIRVLAIDDDESFLRALRSQFHEYGRDAHGDDEFNVEILPTLPNNQALQSFLDRFEPQVILLDLNLPGFRGTDAIRRCSGLWPGIPIIVVTGEGVNGETSEYVAAGASAAFNKVDISSSKGFKKLLQTILRTQIAAGDDDSSATLSKTINRLEFLPTLEHLERKTRRASAKGWAGILTAIIGTGGIGAWHAYAPEPSTDRIERQLTKLSVGVDDLSRRLAQVEEATKTAADTASRATTAADTAFAAAARLEASVKDLDAHQRTLDALGAELKTDIRWLTRDRGSDRFGRGGSRPPDP